MCLRYYFGDMHRMLWVHRESVFFLSVLDGGVRSQQGQV